MNFRGPRDYTGQLARLLPARTSAFVALNDFDGIRKRIGETRLYDQLANSLDLAALLMTNEDWRKYQENKDSVEWKAKAAFAREFLRRYFSREVVVALARLDRCDEPSLLVMARTDLGFAEKLGELCAQLYPELHLGIENYRGIPLFAYEAPRSKRSFTYVRFGKTVVLSLRSNERDYLRRIIDYRLDSPAATLFETGDFQRAWQSPARHQGLLAVASPPALLADLMVRSEISLRDFLEKRKNRWISEMVRGFRFLEGAITVGERIQIRFVAYPERTTSSVALTPAPGKPLSLLAAVPANCMAAVVFRFDDLAETLAKTFNIDRAFRGDAGDSKALAAAVEHLNAQWGADVIRGLTRALGHESAVVVHDARLPMIFEASMLFPVEDRARARDAAGRMIKKYADLYGDPAHAREVPQVFQKTPEVQPLYPLPVGFLGVGWLNDRFILCLSPDSYLAMKQMVEKTGTPITGNAVFQSLDLPVGEPLDAVGFINLEEVGRRAEGLIAVLSLLSKEARERSAMYGKIVAVLKLLRGVGFYLRHTNEEWTTVLRVPTQ